LIIFARYGGFTLLSDGYGYQYTLPTQVRVFSFRRADFRYFLSDAADTLTLSAAAFDISRRFFAMIACHVYASCRQIIAVVAMPRYTPPMPARQRFARRRYAGSAMRAALAWKIRLCHAFFADILPARFSSPRRSPEDAGMLYDR